jgi:hypothetical protein
MTTRTTLVAAAPALILSSVACTDPALDDHTQRSADGEITEGGDIGVMRIQVGDCLGSLPGNGVIAELDAVPCSSPHAAETYDTFDLAAASDDSFPGLEEVDELAFDGCLGRFTPFVGIEYADSIYDISYLHPTSQSWSAARDRRVVCMLAGLDEQRWTGSAEGSAR